MKLGVVGRCEVCKEWGNCGGVGLGVSRCGVCKINEGWGKGGGVGGLEEEGGIVECVQGK